MRRICLALVVWGVNLGCGSGTQPTRKVIEGPTRFGKGIESVSKAFSDIHPSISEDGARVTFVSARIPHEGVYRSYRFAVGTDELAQTLTNGEHGEELKATISPDGNWVLVSTLVDSKERLIFQEYGNRANFLAVSEGDEEIKGYALSTDSPPELALLIRGADGADRIDIIEFLTSGDKVSVSQKKTVGDLVQGEHGVRWTKSGNLTGLMTRYTVLGTASFFYRGKEATKDIGSLEKISHEDFTKVLNLPYAIGDMGFVFVQSRGNQKHQVTPESNKEAPKDIIHRHRIFSSSLDGTNLGELANQQYKILQVGATRVGQLAVSLGYEAFDCLAAGDGRFYGSSLFLYTGEKTKKVLIKYGEDNAIELITENTCESFEEGKAGGDQPLDLQLSQFALAGRFQENKLSLAYKSWHGGDNEIFHLEMTFDGDSLSLSRATRISNNAMVQ